MAHDRTEPDGGTRRAGCRRAHARPFYLLLFAATYYLMSINRPTAFSEGLGRTDALYFTVSVFATVGFGDIAPVSEPPEPSSSSRWWPTWSCWGCSSAR
jgi:Ion channel